MTDKKQTELSKSINQILAKQNQDLSTLKVLSVPETGINALDLFHEPCKAMDFLKAEEMIKLNFGKEYSEEKFNMLISLVKEDNWTAERFHRTVKYFLKTHKYPNWTISDFFSYQVKLYPYSWYLEQINKGVSDKNLEGYRVNGIVLWKMKDGEELPFEKITD